MKITKLTKFRMYLNDGKIIPINPDIIHEFKLKEGMDLTGIYADVEFESMKAKALYYISLKSRTEYELKSKLKQIYSNPKLIEKTLRYVDELGYINDYDYCVSYILTHKNSKLKNTIKLMQKGVSKSIIDRAFNEVPSEIYDDNLENEVIKLKKMQYDDFEIITKLSKKGYPYDKILKILVAHR